MDLIKDSGKQRKQKSSEWDEYFYSSHIFFVQSQKWKHQSNVWNLFKVKNKDNRMTPFLYFDCKLWTHCTYCSDARSSYHTIPNQKLSFRKWKSLNFLDSCLESASLKFPFFRRGEEVYWLTLCVINLRTTCN